MKIHIDEYYASYISSLKLMLVRLKIAHIVIEPPKGIGMITVRVLRL